MKQRSYWKLLLSVCTCALVLLMCLSGTALNTKAAEIVKDGQCGKNITWTLDSQGTLTLTGSGTMYNYEYSENPWHWSSSVKSIVINDGITRIGNYAFCTCRAVTAVSIPDSVTSIGERAFWSCPCLESVQIPNSVTELGLSVFGYCDNLQSVTLSNSISAIEDHLFSDCGKLSAITIPDSVTEIGCYAFRGCKSLSSVLIGANVTSIHARAFDGCDSLTAVTLPDSVSFISTGAFENCSNLRTITLGANVETIFGSAFGYCDNLESIFFTGNRIYASADIFQYVTANAYYPANNDTWTEDVLQDYGGTITWIAYNPLRITAQPKTGYANNGKNAKTTVKAAGDGLTYQWYVKNASASSYTKSSIKTATYSCKMSSKTDGRYVRCKITDKYGNEVWTKTVRLRMSDLAISTQPVSKTVVADKTAKFTVKATGTGLKYQWQYRKFFSSSWKNASATGNKTKTLSVPASVSRHGYQYRCKVTDGTGNTVYTNAVSLYVLGIKTQPKNKTVKVGETANFSVIATGEGLTYQWQYRTSSDGSWKKASAIGCKTETMSVPGTKSRNGYQYRCRIKDSAGNVIYTNIVKLTVRK